MFCIELGMIGLGQSEVEYYARGGARGLFDEDQHPRDDSGLFAKKGGGGAAIADEPFALGQAKPKHGKGGSHEKQGSLFDADLHGAEARDLPGQTNFLGDEPEDTAKPADHFKDAVGRAQNGEATREDIAMLRGFVENPRTAKDVRYAARAALKSMQDSDQMSGIDKSDAPSRYAA